MASDLVYTFLRDQNRPFSINEVLQNVGKDHGKSAVQKALDKLVEKQKVTEKVYGKQKVYCVAQDEATDPNQMSDDLRQIDQQISELTANLKTTEEQLHSNTAELKNLQTKMTAEEARTERDKLREEISSLKTKLNSLKENANPISDEEKTKITLDYEKNLKEYKKRKRICIDITNSILEGYPKTKKHLFEDIGIETDEEVGFKLE